MLTFFFSEDACTGDGGAPLSCSIGGRWFLAGLVAWGIGCGTSNIPGVYVNVFTYLSWVESLTINSTENSRKAKCNRAKSGPPSTPVSFGRTTTDLSSIKT
jgi:secreted trypsin-like serine protease